MGEACKDYVSLTANKLGHYNKVLLNKLLPAPFLWSTHKAHPLVNSAAKGPCSLQKPTLRCSCALQHTTFT
jgi:hypothetical protein